MSDPWDEWTYDDICYECRGYGDDYYLDDDGELVSACSECWVLLRMFGDEGETQ